MPAQTFSDKFLQTLKTDDEKNLGYLKMFIEYFESAQELPPAQINQNPLWRSVKWIKRIMYGALVVVGVSIGVYLFGREGVVEEIRELVVKVYPKLEGEM